MKQQLELADPHVATFVTECGVITWRIVICLECKSIAGLDHTIRQLEQVYGSRLKLRRPRQSGHGWIVRGSIGG